MSEFSEAWTLSRARLLAEIEGLGNDQLRWRLQPAALSIGEMAFHVAGVEISFASQLAGMQLDAEQNRLKLAATEGVVNDNPFPFGEDEITSESVFAALAASRAVVEPMISKPTEAVLQKEIKSALGPMITGRGAFTRLAFHSAYHQGQAYLIKGCPGFPS